MRLCDVDTRVTVQSFDPMNEEYSHDEMTVGQALDFVTDEGCPPTIDAIPVEWLRKKREVAIWQFAGAIDWLLSGWQKEQEAQDVRTQTEND